MPHICWHTLAFDTRQQVTCICSAALWRNQRLVLASENNSNKHDAATYIDTEKREGLYTRRNGASVICNDHTICVCNGDVATTSADS